ncbi:MAG: HAMP domain-containing histidine kinase [Anaerolineae bacterium]|nr:HAMP domain-containing histidine kinase [Anaerolineae bacterium]
MNPEEQLQIYETLYPRRQEIANAWGALMTTLNPTLAEAADLPPKLLHATEHLLKLLIAEPFDARPAQTIGAMLDLLDNVQPEALLQIYELLARELVAGLTAEQIALLYPRVTGLIGAMGVGCAIGKAERAKTFDMNAMSVMGHDLKTPINAITGFSKVILKGIDGPITDFQQQDLTSIHDAGQKLLTMIDEIFRTAKTDAGKTHLYGDEFDVAALLGDVLHVSQPILARYGHALDIRCQGELSVMKLDASRTRWVLLGLLYYVARRTTNSTVSLAVSRETVQDMDWYLFTISVAKPVQTPDEVDFWADDKTEDSDIALITSRRFCEELGGSLTTEESKDDLARFVVRLPAPPSLQ